MRLFFPLAFELGLSVGTSLESNDIRAHIHSARARRFSTKLNVAYCEQIRLPKKSRLCFVILSSISPSLSDSVISITDVDFGDKLFGLFTHFVMFYGRWNRTLI